MGDVINIDRHLPRHGPPTYVEGDLNIRGMASAILGMAPCHSWLSERRPKPSQRVPCGPVLPRGHAEPDVLHLSLTPHHLGP